MTALSHVSKLNPDFLGEGIFVGTKRHRTITGCAKQATVSGYFQTVRGCYYQTNETHANIKIDVISNRPCILQYTGQPRRVANTSQGPIRVAILDLIHRHVTNMLDVGSGLLFGRSLVRVQIGKSGGGGDNAVPYVIKFSACGKL